MKVAVIGASGFIGTRVVEHLHLTDRAGVVAIVRRPGSLALPARFAIPLRVADALDPDAVAQALEGCDAVVHAALGDVQQIERMPVALCRGAAAAGVRRIVYLSSASVHGQNPAAGTDEATPLSTTQDFEYNNAKVHAERKFFAECRRLDLAGFALRPGVVYGPRSRWIADLATDLLERRAWLLGQGRGICNAIYVDNLVEAIGRCLEAGADEAAPFLVGDAETVTWAHFYRRAAAELDSPWSAIHQLKQLPVIKRASPDRTGRAVAHPFVQRLLPLVPAGLKRSAKAALAASAGSPRRESWTLPEEPRPRLTQEMALLQQCAWKFPTARAERALGWKPTVSFGEGMRRSFAWWQFAQGEFFAAR